MAFDFQALCEIAERELNAGLADASLVEQAMAESNNVQAKARQVFWHLRATQLQRLQESDGATRIHELVIEIEAQEQRARRRKEGNRWFWAVACFIGMIGAVICPWFAFRAMGKPGPAFWMFAILAAASLALAIFALIASRYHTDTE